MRLNFALNYTLLLLLLKKRTYERLESFQEDGCQERLNLQSFIFQSIQLINDLKDHLPEQV